MQKIANENNLAETAFFVRKGSGRYDLRWFTPESEVELCGHATLASAWLLFEFLDSNLNQVAFETKSGTLLVQRGTSGSHIMSLPSDEVVPFDEPGLAAQLGEALGSTPPALTLRGRYIVAVWDKAGDVRRLRGPGDIPRVLGRYDVWGLVATAPGDDGYDFVSRLFAPEKGVPEDPVTGSAHCALTPYWAKRLGKKTLKARQVSPRGGDLNCTDAGEWTILSGPCALYMTAEITI
jgi:predicted PhzF superfamily epimerase YddE/YHI9